jgi:hypothetical protein
MLGHLVSSKCHAAEFSHPLTPRWLKRLIVLLLRRS